ncbi:MAG: dihydrofolate reductase-like domain-containing protein [Benniella sp.]|nr:MAG: dihydrofolate reductase-like domain-containing protein [Benniella sp.]
MVSFSIVVAADLANGIGLKGKLPWRLKGDMAFFAKITSKVLLLTSSSSSPSSTTTPTTTTTPTRVNACIMGRLTWESIPPKFRPLPSRFNVIVTRNPHYLDGKPEKDSPLVALASSFENALDLVASLQHRPQQHQKQQEQEQEVQGQQEQSSPIQVERVFLIGGAQLYAQGITSPHCSHIFLTRVHSILHCDTFFPDIHPDQYKLLSGPESHAFLEDYLKEPVQGGMIEEGEGDKKLAYEYTVYATAPDSSI